VRFVVAVPVGPAAVERDRVLDLLDGLRAWEPVAHDVLLVDDDAERRWPAGVHVVPNPRRGRGIPTLGATTCATLTALAWAHERRRGAWVLRLDTDAAVIGPVAARVEAALRPGDGILGSCHRTCTGAVRDVSGIAREVERHLRPVWVWRRPPRRPWWVRPADPLVRGVLQAALRAGYEPGEHCMAAGCAITAPLIAALNARGWLSDPRRWLHARLGDDMVLGAMCRATGLALRDLHEVFGLQHVGLPGEPRELLEAGYGVVHSVKNDARHPEAELRAAFAGARPA
jgi:hypothetical protein